MSEHTSTAARLLRAPAGLLLGVIVGVLSLLLANALYGADHSNLGALATGVPIVIGAGMALTLSGTRRAFGLGLLAAPALLIAYLCVALMYVSFTGSSIS